MSQHHTPPSDADQTICEDVETYAAARALGERDDTTWSRIEAHVQGCASCRATLSAAEHTVRLLPLGAPDALPTPDLRRRVIDAVDVAAHGRPQLAPSPSGWIRWRPQGLWLRRAAVVALLLALAGWNVALQRSLATQTRTAQQQQAVLAELLQTPDVVRIPVVGDTPAPAARGTIVLATAQQTVALAVEDLPVLPDDQVYQLWLIDDGQRTNGGTFTVDAEGRGIVIARAPQPLETYSAIGVSIEPRGGSPAPTSPRVIGGPLS